MKSLIFDIYVNFKCINLYINSEIAFFTGFKTKVIQSTSMIPNLYDRKAYMFKLERCIQEFELKEYLELQEKLQV